MGDAFETSFQLYVLVSSSAQEFRALMNLRLNALVEDIQT